MAISTDYFAFRHLFFQSFPTYALPPTTADRKLFLSPNMVEVHTFCRKSVFAISARFILLRAQPSNFLFSSSANGVNITVFVPIVVFFPVQQILTSANRFRHFSSLEGYGPTIERVRRFFSCASTSSRIFTFWPCLPYQEGYIAFPSAHLSNSFQSFFQSIFIWRRRDLHPHRSAYEAELALLPVHSAMIQNWGRRI